MPALSDRKLELFCQRLLHHLAMFKTNGKAAEAAGKDAGYTGSSMAANSRKRAQRKDVKARLVELAAPAQAQAEAEVACDAERLKARLWQIVGANVDLNETVLPKDVINAGKAIAALEGWNAPTKIDVNKHDSTDWSTAELVAFIADARASLERGRDAPSGDQEPDQLH